MTHDDRQWTPAPATSRTDSVAVGEFGAQTVLLSPGQGAYDDGALLAARPALTAVREVFERVDAVAALLQPDAAHVTDTGHAAVQAPTSWRDRPASSRPTSGGPSRNPPIPVPCSWLDSTWSLLHTGDVLDLQQHPAVRRDGHAPAPGCAVSAASGGIASGDRRGVP